MGITRFYSFLFKNYPNSHKHWDKTAFFDFDIDTLAIDMNNILHMCAQQVFEYGNYSHTRRFLSKKNATKYDYFRHVCSTLDFIVKYVRPKQKLLLCIDGVSSMAKIRQQRVRRYKPLMDYKELSLAEKSVNTRFVSSEISPGTILMDELSKYINWHIHYSLSTNPHWKNLSVIFSNEKVPGEGEHKIFSLIKQLHEENKEYTYCIYGIDADLVMLSLVNLCFCKNILLLRENLFSDNFICIDTRSVHDAIINEFSSYVKDFKEEQSKFILYDFVLIFFFFGNDFLPEIPSLDIELVTFIFNEYKTILSKYGFLTRMDNKFIAFESKNFKEFLFSCSLIESELFFQKTSEEFFPSTILNQSIEKESINMLKFNKLYNETKLENKCQQICHDYLTTCIWNLNYYVNKIIDWNWKYSFYYSPTFTSLFHYFDSYKPYNFTLGHSIFPFLQLLYIIPYHHRHILPETLKDLVPKIEPSSMMVDFTMKRSDREATIIVPDIHEQKIASEYFKRKKLFYFEDRNIVGKNMYYSLTNIPFYYNSKWKDIPNCRVLKVFKS